MNFASERFVSREGDFVITKRSKDRALGGPGSGNFGHAGRPGQIGGSAPAEEVGAPSEERVGIVQRRAGEIAMQMGVDPDIINVVDKDPREFQVGNQQFKEAGHYNPNTKEIEINARNTYHAQMSVTNGVVAHEISHAMFHAAEQAQSVEHEEISSLPKAEYDRLFTNSGYVRPEMQAEVHQRFPVSAFWYRHLGDSYMETAEEQGQYTDKGLSKSRYIRNLDALIYDDGVSSYSAAYWQESALNRINGTRSAINETLAEMARHIMVPGSKTVDDFIGKGNRKIDEHGRWKRFSSDLMKLAKEKPGKYLKELI